MNTIQITDIAQLSEVVHRVMQEVVSRRHQNAASVIALYGELGAGKTAFVKELAQQFGIAEPVTSPTFVILKMYALDDDHRAQESWPFAQLAHIDAYRIEDIDEMRVLRFEELLAQKDTIICIEWAEKIESLLPAHTVHVRIKLQADVRHITLS